MVEKIRLSRHLETLRLEERMEERNFRADWPKQSTGGGLLRWIRRTDRRRTTGATTAAARVNRAQSGVRDGVGRRTDGEEFDAADRSTHVWTTTTADCWLDRRVRGQRRRHDGRFLLLSVVADTVHRRVRPSRSVRRARRTPARLRQWRHRARPISRRPDCDGCQRVRLVLFVMTARNVALATTDMPSGRRRTRGQAPTPAAASAVVCLVDDCFCAAASLTVLLKHACRNIWVSFRHLTSLHW